MQCLSFSQVLVQCNRWGGSGKPCSPQFSGGSCLLCDASAFILYHIASRVAADKEGHREQKILMNQVQESTQLLKFMC